MTASDSETDGLTGLPSRLALMKSWHLFAGRTVAYLDIDLLAQVNLDHGHQAADEVLTQMANRLSSCLLESEFLYRTAGDEFMVVFPEAMPVQRLRERADLLHGVLDGPFKIKTSCSGLPDLEVKLTAGMVVTPLTDITLEAFLERVGEEMYQNKKRGKNQILFT